MKKYRSKIGLELVGFLLLVFGFNLFIAKDEITVMLLVMLPIFAFIAYILFSIKYKIEGETLTVHNAFFIKTKIEIQTIRKINETNNPLSSPAASMDRLEIFYGNKFDSIIISPIQREDFLNELKKINPAIEITLKPQKTIFAKLAL